MPSLSLAAAGTQSDKATRSTTKGASRNIRIMLSFLAVMSCRMLAWAVSYQRARLFELHFIVPFGLGHGTGSFPPRMPTNRA